MEGIGHSERDKQKILVHYEDSKIQQFHSLHSVNEAPCHSHLGISLTNRGDNYRRPNPSLQPDTQSHNAGQWQWFIKQSASHVGTASLCNYGGGFAQHYLLKAQYKKSPKLASEQMFIKKDTVDNEHVEFST